MNHWTQANASDFAYSISLDFFNQLEERIESSGISRKELSEKMEITPSAVSQILNNPPDNPYLETLVQYARPLGLKVAVVVYDDGDPDNDKGPIYSGVFEKTWQAMGCPRDLSMFNEVSLMKVEKDKFEAVFKKLLDQGPSKRETLKTGEKKKSQTIIPPRPQPGR